MRILVSNDDGYFAPGVSALAEALSTLGEVTVVAPERDRSGASNSLTLDRPLSLKRTANGFYHVNGTPTDCVHLAVTGMLDNLPDMVVSGVNHGANMGDDTVYSGTVAAATEGFLLGVPSIAVSLVSKSATDFTAAARVARDLAERFNSRFGETFTMPRPVIQKETARIYDLQNPTSKMSKSAESDAGVLWLLDDPKATAKKIMRAVTDDEGSVRYDREAKPGVSNLLVIYSALTGREMGSIEDEYAGRGYGDFKKGLAEVVVGEFEPVRTRALELLDDPAELDRALGVNAERAAAVADRTLADVYDKMGLLRRV